MQGTSIIIFQLLNFYFVLFIIEAFSKEEKSSTSTFSIRSIQC
jgi:hypothetical protein